MVSEKIKEFARNLGADLIGIGDAKRMDEAPPGHKPTDYLPDAKSIIVVVVRINYSAVEGLPITRNEYVNAGDAAGVKINNIIFELARKLEEEGFSAIPFFGGEDSKTIMGDLSLKHAAVAAGLGEFGLNNLFLAPKCGPRVIIAAIITNAEIKPNKPFQGQLCDLCEDCLKICPSGALKNPQGYDRTKGWTIDKHKCNHYINEILKPIYGHFSCGMCIMACHVGRLQNK